MPGVSNQANKYNHKKIGALGQENAAYFFLKNAGIKSSSVLFGAFSILLAITGRTLEAASTCGRPLK